MAHDPVVPVSSDRVTGEVRWGGLGRGYDVENVIFVAEEEPRRVFQAWDVGREVWVWSTSAKKRKERNKAHTVAASVQSTLEGVTPGDTHVIPIMTGYYLIPPCKSRAYDFQCYTNKLSLIWYWRWHCTHDRQLIETSMRDVDAMCFEKFVYYEKHNLIN